LRLRFNRKIKAKTSNLLSKVGQCEKKSEKTLKMRLQKLVKPIIIYFRKQHSVIILINLK